MSKVLSYDGGVKETFHYSAHDDTAAIQVETDVTNILEANKFQRSNQTMRHQSEAFNHVARIDVNAINIWCKQRGIKYGEFLGNPEILQKFLNDPDNKAWRTRTGKI